MSALRPAPSSGSDAFTMPPRAARRRYAIIGCGARSMMYQDALEGKYQATAELVALCDRNAGRLKVAQQRSASRGVPVPPAYLAEDFSRLIAEAKPDVLIILTVDAAHHEYIIRGMRAGCDVITEKPMTTTAETCQQILDARRETGKSCRVTFNYRYSPPRTQVKELLMSGVIGEVHSIDFHWLLDTVHGADYFRRWHGDKRNSGGLMVHKATHHFDLVNWWLSAVPTRVYASGTREFYRPETARRFGLQSYHERCLTCPEKEKCTFYLDISSAPILKELYLDQEKHDGYLRDRCVWRPDISIEDTMSVSALYSNGTKLTYSLSAYNAWEGYTIAFNGSKGRLEHSMVEQMYVSGRDALQGGVREGGVSTRFIPLRGAPHDIEVWRPEGSHGGGDQVLLDDLFAPEPTYDKFLRAADERAGAYSILVGIAANHSFETGQPVKVADLVKGLEAPVFPPMPNRAEPLTMPPRR